MPTDSTADDSVDGDVSDVGSTNTSGQKLYTADDVNRIVRDRLARGKGSNSTPREPSPVDKLTATVGSLAEIVAKLVPQPRQEVDVARSGAAAPQAPSGAVNRLTTDGLVDLFNLGGDQIESLGPEGLRRIHEQNLAHGRSRSGAPPRPQVLRNRNK
jgi:hypothetical protein